MKILIMLFAMVVATAQATPTAEGLFSNANNKDPSGNLIVLTAMVEPISAPLKENSLVTPPIATEGNELVASPVYYKWLLSLEREKYVDVIQVRYDNPELKESQVKSARYLPDLRKVIASDNSLERSLFYGLIGVLVLNRPEMIAPVLNKYAQGFVLNKDLMSREKVNLYSRYKDYLEKRQDNETLVSPLMPDDPEKSEQVKEILNAPMYRDAGNVKLTRIDGELVWKVDLKSMIALFSNENHRLKRLTYQSPLGDLRFMTDDFVLFDGSHELPKILIVKDMSGKTWKVRFTGLSHITSRSTPFTKRAQDYAEAAKSSMKTSLVPGKSVEKLEPPFIF